MQGEGLFNGIILPDGTRAPFKTPISHNVAVQVINVRNHPAFNRKTEAKQLVATGLIENDEIIGLYGGEVSFDLTKWNTYQLATSTNAKYCIDAFVHGNEMRFINDHTGIAAEPNAKFFIADERVGKFDVAVVVALRVIQAGEEILVSYGKGYWEELEYVQGKAKVYVCTQCDYSTQKKEGLYQHVKTRHSPRELFTCDYCSGTFVSKQMFNEHVNVQHTGAYEYWCQECSFSTLSYMGMHYHMKKKHSDTVFKCLECNKKFAALQNLRLHVCSFHNMNKKQKV